MLATTLLLALREIRRHVLRSVLTILGIVIGVFSVITMVTLGNGATASVRTSISALGSDILQVLPSRGGGPGGGTGVTPPNFQMSDLDAIREQIGGVTSVAGQAQTAATAVHNSQNWSTTINGTTNDYFHAQKWSVRQGREFTPQEEQAGKSACIIGATIVKNLWQSGDPVGDHLRVKNISCEVVGVLATRGQGTFGNDQDDVVIMPIKAVQRQLTGVQDARSIMIGIDPAYDTKGIQQALTGLLRERRGLTATQDDNFVILDARQLADTIGSITGILTGLIGAIAGISLLVGGIGIMNIMLVSVTERTREIGIRLAIGALGQEVLLQFLVEAVALSCLGGLVGMALAFIVCGLASPLLGLPFLFDAQINLLSFVFSALIGVVFGYFPARRAASLNPIEALRHE